jgi:hypothetical protein
MRFNFRILLAITILIIFYSTIALSKTGETSLHAVSNSIQTPSITVTPSSISFRDVRKDSTKQLTFKITNSSTIALQIDSLWTNTKYFNVARMLASGQIRIGDTAKSAIYFTPDSMRDFYDTLFIANNSPVSPCKVPLYGRGTDASPPFVTTGWNNVRANLKSGIDSFSISTHSPVDYGAMSVFIYVRSTKIADITSKFPWSMSRIANDTSAAILWYASDGITPVHFNANEPIVTVTLEEKTGEGSSVTIEYEFADIKAKVMNKSISISNSTPSSSIEVNPPSEVSFDSTRIDNAKQALITITNPSTITLQIDSIWTDSKHFIVTRIPEHEQIMIGDTEKFTIRFTPDSMKGYFSILYIANNSSVSPYRIRLYGVGIDSLTELKNKSWKSIQANLMSEIDTFSISASSPLDLSELSMKIYHFHWPLSIISKLNPGYVYSYEDECLYFTCSRMPPVHFDAYEPILKVALAKETVHSSSVRIDYELADNNGKWLNINLLVSCNLPRSLIEVNPSSVSFGKVKKDSIQQLSFSITNPSILALKIDSIWTSTKYFEITKMPMSEQIRTGDTVKAAIQFIPDSDRIYIDTIFIANNSPVSPYKVPLYGTNTSITPGTGSLKNYQADFISGFNTFTISAQSPIDFGVMSMWIYVKSSKIIGINSKIPDLVGNIVNDTSIVLSWISVDCMTPVHFNANEPIITVTLAEKTGQGSGIRIEYEFADIQGTILNTNISISNSIPSSVQGNTPIAYELRQNYPNPFNPSTTIQYGLSARSSVRLIIYDVLGRTVADLVNSEQQAGIQSVIWNANVASGLYFYRLEATSLENPSKRFVETKKMLLLR